MSSPSEKDADAPEEGAAVESAEESEEGGERLRHAVSRLGETMDALRGALAAQGEALSTLRDLMVDLERNGERINAAFEATEAGGAEEDDELLH